MLFLLPSCGLSARRCIDPSSCFLSPPPLGSGHGEEAGGGGFNPRCLWADCGVTPGTSRQFVAGPQREQTPRSYWSACCDWGNVDNCTTQRQKGGRQTLKFLTATPQSSSKRNKSPARKNKEKEKSRDCRWMTRRRCGVGSGSGGWLTGWQDLTEGFCAGFDIQTLLFTACWSNKVVFPLHFLSFLSFFGSSEAISQLAVF